MRVSASPESYLVKIWIGQIDVDFAVDPAAISLKYIVVVVDITALAGVDSIDDLPCFVGLEIVMVSKSDSASLVLLVASTHDSSHNHLAAVPWVRSLSTDITSSTSVADLP